MIEHRLREGGMTAADAAAASRRIMGNDSLAREDAPAVWVWSRLDSTRQDVSYALRSLRHRPGFACLVVLTLGAAIGVNTTLFTVFNAVFLRPWPVPDGSNVFEVTITHDDLRPQMEEFSLGEFRHLQDHARTVAGLMAAKCAFEREQRTREIGVRMTLGARPRQVVGFILRSSSPALVIGRVGGSAPRWPARD